MSQAQALPVTTTAATTTRVRKYTVREACPDGTIDTVGEFQQYRTLAQAKANVAV